MAFWETNRELTVTGSVLLVMGTRDYGIVARRFAQWGVEVTWAGSIEVAETILALKRAFTFVITADQLPDGGWRNVADSVRRAGSTAMVLVKHTEAEFVGEQVRESLGDERDVSGTAIVEAAA
ncbi:MAG: hypothetical protein ACKV22_18080 [Bryobacteraceae bacterium]